MLSTSFRGVVAHGVDWGGHLPVFTLATFVLGLMRIRWVFTGERCIGKLWSKIRRMRLICYSTGIQKLKGFQRQGGLVPCSPTRGCPPWPRWGVRPRPPYRLALRHVCLPHIFRPADAPDQLRQQCVVSSTVRQWLVSVDPQNSRGTIRNSILSRVNISAVKSELRVATSE